MLLCEEGEERERWFVEMMTVEKKEATDGTSREAGSFNGSTRYHVRIFGSAPTRFELNNIPVNTLSQIALLDNPHSTIAFDDLNHEDGKLAAPS